MNELVRLQFGSGYNFRHFIGLSKQELTKTSILTFRFKWKSIEISFRKSSGPYHTIHRGRVDCTRLVDYYFNGDENTTIPINVDHNQLMDTLKSVSKNDGLTISITNNENRMKIEISKSGNHKSAATHFVDLQNHKQIEQPEGPEEIEESFKVSATAYDVGTWFNSISSKKSKHAEFRRYNDRLVVAGISANGVDNFIQTILPAIKIRPRMVLVDDHGRPVEPQLDSLSLNDNPQFTITMMASTVKSLSKFSSLTGVKGSSVNFEIVPGLVKITSELGNCGDYTAWIFDTEKLQDQTSSSQS